MGDVIPFPPRKSAENDVVDYAVEFELKWDELEVPSKYDEERYNPDG